MCADNDRGGRVIKEALVCNILSSDSNPLRKPHFLSHKILASVLVLIVGLFMTV